ncbi:SusC/RagA family TonB-linked outer membrane protein [Mucilaginibacter paludis]|uniref:TonB-dependent receptor plug n=1 Tax=Mucilaginibacter paludis DSM 18603 TaxID=714943 RepID=H1YE36_9SPHI|nr:SusC/RagA family TonB-linked outer membrane protein [Mucilaginibacter paludis]EHQ25214.1 TonB-dependent receptor plug [Mucilaginibacter paludis DSM 18603]
MNFSAQSAEGNSWRVRHAQIALFLSPYVIRQIMRISLCTAILVITTLHLLLATSVSGQKVADVSVTISLENESFESAIKKIESATKFRFIYRDQDLKTFSKLNLPAEKRTVAQTLDLLFKNSAYTYKQLNNSIMIISKPALAPAPAKERTEAIVRHVLKVYITDVDGQLLPFANITVKGSTRMVVQANQDGYAYIPSISDKDVLIVSFVGYTTQEIIVGSQETIHVKLVRDPASTLKEVSVISNGYQTLPKERSTGAFSTATAKDIEKIPIPNIVQILEGMVPGLQVAVTAGDRTFDYNNTQQAVNGNTRTVGTNDYNMTIRGTSTLSAESFPLIVVDGAVSTLDLSTINPNDIDNVTFLKDAAAASIWGIRAANGVIVINTKKGINSAVPKISFSTNFSFSGKPDLGYLKTMTSAQTLNYEKELVDRGFVTDLTNSTYYNAAANVRSQGSLLALQLKAGTITQAQYDAQVVQLSTIDNRSQISKYLLQNAQSQQYNFAVSGGNDFSNYYYSASYSKELPNTIGNSAKRLTLNLTHNWKLFKVADLSVNIKGSSFKYVNDGIALSSLCTASQSTLMPYSLLKDANGNNLSYDFAVPSSYTATLSSARPNWQYSYLNEQNNNDNTQKDNDYTATVNLRIPVFKGLNASGLYSTERTFSTTRTFYNQDSYYYRNFINYYTAPTASVNSIGITNGGILNLVNTNNNNYTVRGQLDYSNTFAQVHQVTALAGTEIRETQLGQGTETLYGYNLSSGLSTGVNAGNTSATNVGYATVTGNTFNLASPTSQADKTRRYLSYYGNAAYTYNNKYVLTGSVRYDDYNNFGLDRQYRATPAWSAGAKWNLSDEAFMKQFTWIDHLALRATYGINGNISTTVYPFTYISIGTDGTTGLPNSSILYTANPQLKWEKTYVTNLAADFSFLNSRISGSVDYYKKNSKDILASFAINNTYTGNINSGVIVQNSSHITGKGVDLSLNGIAYNTKDWRWNLGGTFSYNTNQLEDERYTKQYTSSAFATTSYYANPSALAYLSGYPTDKIMVFRNAGLDANGLTQVYAEDGSIIKATTAAIPTLGALKYAGRRVAPYYGSWNTSVRYKDFTLFALTTYQFGNVFLKPSIGTYSTNINQVKYDLSADIANRWQKPGDEATTNVPGLNGTSTAVNASLVRYQYSDINVLKGDYIRLREVSLSYQLPTALTNKVMIKNAKLGFAVRNLGLLWTANKQGYDPDFVNSLDRTYSLPATPSYILSLNVNL